MVIVTPRDHLKKLVDNLALLLRICLVRLQAVRLGPAGPLHIDQLCHSTTHCDYCDSGDRCHAAGGTAAAFSYRSTGVQAADGFLRELLLQI